MTEPQMGISESELTSLTTDDERWKRVDSQFAALNLRQSTQDLELADVKASVSENTKITQQIAADTSAILAAWNDGVAAKRFFCRLAQAWEFMLKRVMLPGLVTVAVIAILHAVFSHSAVPDWAAALAKSFVGM